SFLIPSTVLAQQGGHAGHAQHGATTPAHHAAQPGSAARAPIPADARVGTIVLAHGGGPEWRAQVEQAAALVNTGGPVVVSFLMGLGAKTNRFQDVVHKLAAVVAEYFVVVPMRMSLHSGH